MKKDELIAALAEHLAVSKKDAEAVCAAWYRITVAALKDGGEITFPYIGKLTKVVQKARKARNPRTGETLDVPEKNVVRFKPATALSESVNA